MRSILKNIAERIRSITRRICSIIKKLNSKIGKMPSWSYTVIMVILAAVFCVSAYFLIDYAVEQNNASLSYNELSTIVTENRPANEEPEVILNEDTQTADAPPIVVNHEDLSVINPNYDFWLHLDNSVISYPVVANAGNSWFLSHLFSGEKNANGCLFVDESCETPLMPGINTLVHGHRMNSGKMFGSLHNFLEEDYALAHSEFYISSARRNYKGTVFSAYISKVGGDYTTISFESDAERENYIKERIADSEVHFGIMPDMNAPIVTLATCVKHHENRRMIVMMTLEEIY